MKLIWSIISAVITCVFLVDLIAWLVSGAGLGEMITGGVTSPMIVAIADHIIGIPDWAFYLVCAVAVVVLSVIISLCFVSCIYPNNIPIKRRFKA